MRRGRNSMNETRTIKPEVPALLLVASLCQHTAIPLLDNKASQYLSFMLKNSSCSTTWEQHRFCIESPVLRSSNHFKDSISSKFRISLRGKEEACIVKGSILHTVKTRQAEVNDLSLVRCESETEPPGKASSFLGHCSILLILSLEFLKATEVAWSRNVYNGENIGLAKKVVRVFPEDPNELFGQSDTLYSGLGAI